MQLLMLLTLCLGSLQLALAADAEGPPACGLKCIVTSTANSGCTVGNTTCICTNEPLLAKITDCVKEGCSIRDQLATKKYSAVSCGIKGQDRRALVRNIAVIFGALGVAAFVIRCVTRITMGLRTWGHDDTAMCLTMCLMIPLAGISIPLSDHGLGLDIWYVAPDDITEILHLYYFDEMLYISSLATTKISMLLFYLKVFPQRYFRVCTWVLIGLNVVYALVYDFLLTFQCHPIPGVWRSWDGEYEARCISINLIGWTAAAINILLDLLVIILPLPELLRLSMSLKKKVQIVSMFAVGFLYANRAAYVSFFAGVSANVIQSSITVVSVLRLSSLIRFGTTENVTQDYVEVGYWSTIEVPVGVMCACMPAARSLLGVTLPRIFGSTKGGTSKLGSYGPSSILRLALGPNKIRVDQEWTVLREYHTNDGQPRNDSDVELVRVGEEGTHNGDKQNDQGQ